MSDNDTFETGTRALRIWYESECRSCALEVLKEAKKRARDAEDEILHEMIDSHEFIIYTHKAQLVIALSEHSDAYEDEVGEKAPTDEARAYMAMVADVRAYMDALRDVAEDEEANTDEEGK